MKQIGNTYFIESENIKVFPCSYRGFDKSGNVYDPEATGFTEYNFVNIYGKQTKLISWTDNLLKCVINGYYFEIKNITPAKLCINKELYKFKIVTTQLTIVDNYTTEVLAPIGVANINYLDTTIEGIDCFTGLAIVPADENTNGAIYFSPCKLVGEKNNKEAVIDWQAYRLTDVLDTDSGDGSVRMLGTVKNNKSTVCHATGENAFAIGKNTEASGKFSMAGGAESKAEYENSVAIGNNVNTSANNQVVFGAYNEKNTNAALIIGNGDESTGKNILEVSKAGDINATGKLDVDGNISSSNGGLNLTNGFINITHNYKEPGSDEVKTRSSLLKENGDLKIDGDVQFNEALYVKKQAEIDGDITGHGSLTINGASKTHALTLGSLTGTGDYGSITVYGKTSTEAGQETKITAFSVNNEGEATIAKMLKVGNDKLVVDANGVSINNSKVTIANPTIINNTLTVKGSTTINANNVATTINENKIDYNSKFTVTKDGDITANSLSIATNYGITIAGKITGSELELGNSCGIAANGNATLNNITAKSLTLDNGYGIDISGRISVSELALGSRYGIETDGNATLGNLIIDNATLGGIKIEKGSYSVKESDGIREINNSDALKITKYSADNKETTQGLHVNGKITAAGDFAIGESTGVTTKITQAGAAYFKQGLLVGGKVTSENEPDDNVTFRVASFSSDNADSTSYATLKGNLNIKKYSNKAGNLTVEGTATIDGSLTIGSENSGINLGSNGNITRVKTIQAEKFNATSDIRKKTAIKDYVCKKSILDLPVKEFEFINDETHTKNIGCIAQDLQEICPEIVHEGTDGYLSIEENKLVYLLLQEVKELKREVKALKEK